MRLEEAALGYCSSVLSPPSAVLLPSALTSGLPSFTSASRERRGGDQKVCSKALLDMEAVDRHRQIRRNRNIFPATCWRLRSPTSLADAGEVQARVAPSPVVTRSRSAILPAGYEHAIITRLRSPQLVT
jgi:hypothetical protein